MVIADPAQRHASLVLVPQDIGCPRVAVARLAHAADIDDVPPPIVERDLPAVVPTFLGLHALPQDDESQFQVQARAPEGASLETTQTIMESIASRVRALRGSAFRFGPMD